jgi:hypothetical protein
LRVEQVEIELAFFVDARHVEVGHFIEQLRRNRYARRRCVGRVPVVHRVRVVDRHANLKRVHRPQAAGAPDRQRARKHHRMPDAPIIDVFRLALHEAALVDAVLKFFEGNVDMVARDRVVRFDAVALFLDPLLQMTVQPLGVNRVERVLHDLQPVAIHHRTADHTHRAGNDEPVEPRQLGNRRRTEIREEHAAEFSHRIRRRLRALGKRAAVRFVRLIDALPGSVELPAVIGTANAVEFGDAVGKRCAAMRTQLGDQAEFSAAIAEEHEVFAEETDAFGPRRLQVFRRGDRVPIAAQQRAHRRSRADAGQAFVLFSRDHRSTEPLRPSCWPG